MPGSSSQASPANASMAVRPNGYTATKDFTRRMHETSPFHAVQSRPGLPLGCPFGMVQHRLLGVGHLRAGQFDSLLRQSTHAAASPGFRRPATQPSAAITLTASARPSKGRSTTVRALSLGAVRLSLSAGRRAVSDQWAAGSALPLGCVPGLGDCGLSGSLRRGGQSDGSFGCILDGLVVGGVGDVQFVNAV